MFSVFFYIVPALLIRYLIWREQLKKGEAFGVSVILLFVLFVVSIFLRKSMGDSMLGGSLPWVLIASVWSYFILRAKGENAEPVEAPSLQQKTITPQKKQVEIEPKASTPTKKETETIPAPRAERVEPAKTEKPTMSSSHDDEQFYEQVAAEFNDGTIKQGLWLKAETKAGGDKDKARLLYIEWRVQQLTEEADKAKQAKAWEELVEAEAQANKERDEEGARLANLNRKITSREEAEDCIAPIKPFGYRLLGGVDDGELKWHIHSPWPLEPKNVPQDKLVKFVDEVLSNQEEADAVREHEERITKEAEELEAKKKEERLIREEEELREKIRLFALTSSDSRIDLEKLLAVLEEAGYSHDGKSKYVDETCCTLYKNSADYGYGAAPRKDKVGTFENIGELREWVKINFPQ